jgi:hypothetical protein
MIDGLRAHGAGGGGAGGGTGTGRDGIQGERQENREKKKGEKIKNGGTHVWRRNGGPPRMVGGWGNLKEYAK